MNFALFGYPKTGKTTLFNLLTGAHLDTAAFDDGHREPSHRSCPIPDERLDRLAELYKEKMKTPAALELSDLHGISYGEVKNSALLGLLRKADGLVHVVRAFSAESVPQSRPINPGQDIRTMEEELALADFISIETRLEKLDKDLKKAKSPEGEKEREVLQKLKAAVEAGRGICDAGLTATEEKLVRSFAFLSQKPLLHLINADEKDAPRLEDAAGLYGLGATRGQPLGFCGRVESEILQLEPGEAQSFLDEFGLGRTARQKFFEAAPRLLDLIFFFTIGKDEVRAWPIKRNTPALAAAGAIHTDIERGFIRAEVVSVEELFRFGSLQAAKDKGAVRLEGKDYTVQDGDVIYFRFST